MNLPFETPDPAGYFFERLPVDVQELLFRNYHDLFEGEVQDGEGDAVEQYLDEIEFMEETLKEGGLSEITSYLDGEFTGESIERTNPFTHEKVFVQERTTDRLTLAQARIELQKEIDKLKNFLNESLDVRMKKFWSEDLEYFSEGALFRAARSLPGLDSLIAEYEQYAKEQEVIGRARRKNLHPDYAAEAIKCKEAFEQAEALEKSGDSSLLEKLKELTPAALEVQSQGRRITSQGGPCYICGKFVWPFGGELLLWNEIPKDVRAQYIPDVFQKWHIRHFGPECSREEFGQRDFFLHPKGPFTRRNAKSEKCIVCDIEVPAEQGWLIPASLVPKWKQARLAFPGAKTKNYYVSCGKEE